MKIGLVNVLKFFKRNILLRTILELKKNKLLPGFIPTLFIGYDYQTLKFENSENYKISQPDKIKILSENLSELIYSTPTFDRVSAENYSLQKVKGYKTYAAVIEDVEVSGGSNLIILNEISVLYDLRQFDHENKIYFSDQGIRYYHKDHLLVKTIKSELSIDSAISLVGNFSWNYYHLMFEVLVKFQKLNELNLDNKIPILVDKIVLDVPQYFKLISLLNVQNRILIPLDKGVRYSVKKLHHISCPNLIPPDFVRITEIKPEDILFNKQTIDFLRSNLLSHSSQKEFPKKIFISRSKASGRRNFNEDEVFKVFERHHFEKVYPEDYSIVDQIALFNNAEFIAGGAGAAFTNLLFCRKSCKVISFAKYNLLFSGFSTIANQVGVQLLNFTEHSSLPKKSKNIHESFTIQTDKLNSLVSEWL